MARSTVLVKTATIILGIIVPILLAGAEDDMRTTVLSYTAQRNRTGIWNFLVKTAGKTSLTEQPHFDFNIKISETEQPSNKEKGKCVELVAGAHVSWSSEISQKSPSQHTEEQISKLKSVTVPTGYIQIAGLGYYRIYNEEVKWETARRRCAQDGAHLLVINSELEAAAVVATSGLVGWIYIGFDDFSAEGEFVTLHGTTLEEAGYVHWAKGEPETERRCGIVNEDGLMGAGTCKIARPFICELHGPDEHVLETRNPLLPLGYKALGTLGYYRVHHELVQWETARRRCEAEGAHLMVPNSPVEAAAVLRTSGVDDWVWLGFDDFDNEGEFSNFDGQRLGSEGVFSDFAPGEPEEGVHCGVGRDDAKLGAAYCAQENRFVCELYNPNEKPTPKPSGTTPPTGYVALGNTSYYKVHGDEVMWEVARRRCEDEGAHLLIVNSQAEADAVLKGSGPSGWFWVGFDDYDADGEYFYLDGTRLVDSGYVQWASGEPDESVNCGVARNSGLLGTGTCNVERQYICEWEIPSSSSLPSPYPPGYYLVSDLGVYKVHRDLAAWETARRVCEAEGAHLIVINSEREASEVLGTSGLPSWIWIGFDDFDNAGEYVTLLGTTLKEAGYVKWSSGEPDEEFSCGVAGTDGLFGTGSCSWKREYICELKVR